MSKVLSVVVFLPYRIAVIYAGPAAVVADMKALPGIGALAMSPSGFSPQVENAKSPLNVELENEPFKFLV